MISIVICLEVKLMDKKEHSKAHDINGIEDWLQQFFNDPFTNYLDEYQFRVDLFETDSAFIIEAELSTFKKDQVSVEIDGSDIIIQAKSHPQNSDHPPTIYERQITLPFPLSYKVIEATYEKGIVEVIVNKEGKRKTPVKTIKIK